MKLVGHDAQVSDMLQLVGHDKFSSSETDKLKHIGHSITQRAK